MKNTIISMLFGIVVAGMMFHMALTSPEVGSPVDCYDRYGNKIIGEQCIEEFDGQSFGVFMGIFFFIMITGLGVFLDSFDNFTRRWY